MPPRPLDLPSTTASQIATDALRVAINLEQLGDTPLASDTRRALITRLTDLFETTQRVYGPLGLQSVLIGVAAHVMPANPAPPGHRWSAGIIGPDTDAARDDIVTITAARWFTAVWNEDFPRVRALWTAATRQPWAGAWIYQVTRQAARSKLRDQERITISRAN